jgi:hypothetical protein
MDYVGIAVHKNQRQSDLFTEAREVLYDKAQQPDSLAGLQTSDGYDAGLVNCGVLWGLAWNSHRNVGHASYR